MLVHPGRPEPDLVTCIHKNDKSQHFLARKWFSSWVRKNNTDIWSPRISGNMIKLSLDSVSRSGFYPFTFTIDRIELGVKKTNTTGTIDFPSFLIIALGLYSIKVPRKKNTK